MLFKEISELYIKKRVRILPKGAARFIECLNELENMIKTPGLINITKKDFLRITSGAKKITIIVLEATGKNKGKKLYRELKKLVPEAANKKSMRVLFHVNGDENLTLSDVNDVAEGVYAFLRKEAEIVFTANIDNKLRNSIRLFLLLAE